MTKSYLDKIETNVTKSVFKIFQRVETKHNLLQGLGEAIDRQTYPKFWKGWFFGLSPHYISWEVGHFPFQHGPTSTE